VHLRNGAATDGGCLHVTDGSLTLEDVMVDDCVASENGGAVFADSSAVVLIRANVRNSDATTGSGGGLWLNDSPLLADDCTFHDLDSGGYGGAMAIEGGDHTISRSVFTTCDALDGGAIDALGEGTLSVVGSRFHHNEADDTETWDTAYGGAITSSGMSLSLVNSTLVDNQAEQTAGVYFHTSDPLDELEIRNCIFAHQLGDAMGFDGLPTLGSGTVSVVYNDFHLNETLIDGRDDPGEFDETNLFEDPAFLLYLGWGEENDFHLDAGSPAIDAGDPDQAYLDLDGSRADMGCYGGPQSMP
ncbi:MAG: right-handed parallel beta-helix repeat-containing protein, partial [Myxococcota bacterium]|nr:right-handed parallel beta-helix repeat-containing protein [Myxococcota bacterium]